MRRARPTTKPGIRAAATASASPCVQKDFGNRRGSQFAQVEVSKEENTRLRHIAVEIGTGMTSSQSILCARWFGRPADDVQTAQTDWSDLPLVATHDPWLMQQDVQDKQEKNPRWTPHPATPTSASNSAYFYGHATSEAARLSCSTTACGRAALAL